MASQPREKTGQVAVAPRLNYVDRPDVVETFADSIQSVLFDGQSLRLNFCVTRLDEIKQGEPPSGKRYPACRLVLSPNAAIDLINQMQRISAALTKAGVLKPTAAPESTSKN